VDNLFDRRYTTGFLRLGQPRLLRLELAWRLWHDKRLFRLMPGHFTT